MRLVVRLQEDDLHVHSIESMFVINEAKGYGCTSNEPFSGEHVANRLSPEPGFPYFFGATKKKGKYSVNP